MLAARFDVETYSEAGFIWDEERGKWGAPPGARNKGIRAVGTAAYCEHPTTEVLTASYMLPGQEVKRWRPGEPPPADLMRWLEQGGAIESHKAMFERLIWENVLTPRHGWPALNPYQQRCSMATARVNQYPGALGDLSEVLRLPVPKDKDGKRLLDKFSMPRDPTKKDPRTRIRPQDDPADFERLCAYCDTDVIAEDGAATRMPEMTPDELLFWWIDQEINHRGLGIDRAAVRDCIAVLEQAHAQYGQELRDLTGGIEPTQLQQLQGWLRSRGVHMRSMDADAVDAALLDPFMPADARRVLEVRQLLGSASVKKLYAMENQACRDDRLRDLLQHHGARTGRPTGEGPQPLNLPKAGPPLRLCVACEAPFAERHIVCPWCGTIAENKPGKWAPEYVQSVLDVMSCRNLQLVEHYFGDALLCISGVLRGLFVARDGYELIASDYSAIEAVVIAMMAGEQWRIDAFRDNLPIYYLSASKITGTPLDVYLEHKARTGAHHPDRQKIGKVAELGLGFGGWLAAWLRFDDSGTFTEDEIKGHILAWREASPAIVEMWGGQHRGRPWDRDRRQEYYGVEGMAILAILHPGATFDYRGIKFYMRGDALIIRLLSGRELTYHNPRLSPSQRDPSEYAITYNTWNSNPQYGPMGWVTMQTYGGRLTENIVQATAHDIQRHSIKLLRLAGYPMVLHVYDENVGEVPIGAGSIEEFERLMMVMPEWAHDWPIRAAGGWRGRRYRKVD